LESVARDNGKRKEECCGDAMFLYEIWENEGVARIAPCGIIMTIDFGMLTVIFI